MFVEHLGHLGVHLAVEQTHLLADLGLLLVAALGGGIVAYLLRQPLIVGYILGGIVVSPFTPGPQVSNPQAFGTFADIGVVLLMFSIGAELLGVRKVAVFGAPTGIMLIILMAFLVGWLLGWPVPQRFVIGATVSVCSTLNLERLLGSELLHAAPGAIGGTGRSCFPRPM
jgi:monovalent cation:H+ antiporter-2, CPA2 family